MLFRARLPTDVALALFIAIDEQVNPTKEPAVFRRDPELAAATHAKASRLTFWIDVLVFLANLFFLYNWMFEFGYLPDWAVISRLFFFSTVVSFSQHRMFKFSKAKSFFFIAVSDAGIVIEDYYSRAIIEKTRLQAVVPANTSSIFTPRMLALVIDNKQRFLPDHIIDQQGLIRELTDRLGLPLVEQSETVKRGWQISTVKTILATLGILIFMLSLLAAISELTSGLVRVALFLILFSTIMFAMHRFLSAVIIPEGATIKRRNPALDMMLVPILIVTVLCVFEAVEMADRPDPKEQARTPASELSASRLAALDPPPRFESLFKQSSYGNEFMASLTQAIEDWPAEERASYERILIDTTADPTMIAAQPESPPDGTIKVELSNRRVVESGNRRRFWRGLAPTIEREDVILGLVRGLCLCAAELEGAQAEIFPGYVTGAAAAYRYFAADTLREYQSRGKISRKSAIELINFVRELETVLPTSATLLKTEDACWSEQLKQYCFAAADLPAETSRKAPFPDPETPEIKQLRLALFELPLPVLKSFEAGNATFPAILVDLNRCKGVASMTIEGWGYRVYGKLLLPFQLQNFMTLIYFDYDWGEIWIKDTKGRQYLHTLGFAAALASYQAETGSAPASLAELCDWLKVSTSPVQPPRDLFSGGLLNYEVASAPHLFSVGPDGQSGTDDDIVLYP
ncbi:MAG: hypothetical protein KKB51_22870 [Candidatus Riflebacteria bacterium]|nr:hypothetical protein [Candidatus Riflebacteria bacterium]